MPRLRKELNFTSMSSIMFNVVMHTHKGAACFWVVEKENIEHEVDPVPMRKTLKFKKDTVPDISTLA